MSQRTEYVIIRVKPETKKKWRRVLMMAKNISYSVTAEDLLLEALDYLEIRLKSQLRRLL